MARHILGETLKVAKSSRESTPLSRVIFLRSFLPGMLILLAFSVLSGKIILNAIRGSFEERLRSSQKLFVETIAPDLLMGANAQVYGRCQIYAATLPVTSIELKDLNGHVVCGPWDSSRRGGVSIESPIYFDESHQDVASVLRVRYSTSILGAVRLRYVILLAAAIFVLGLIQFTVTRIISASVSAPIADASRLLSSGDVVAIQRGHLPRTGIDEVDALSVSMKELAARLVDYQKELVAAAQREAIVRMAAQVAHDIRSPLAALDAALADTASVPEEKRRLLNAASARIRDIAEGLLRKDRARSEADGGRQAFDVEDLVGPLVDEKRLVLPEGVRFESRKSGDVSGVFAIVDPVAFKRVVSNLINNAFEALEKGGWVRVTVDAGPQEVRVTVADGGKGMPPEILARIGERGFSWGKEGGSGLGLSHAKGFAEANGGRLDVESETGKGTAVTIRLPRAEPPAWFVSELSVPRDGDVLVLDDDPGIHEIWESRFRALSSGGADVPVRHFFDPEGIRRWVRAQPAKAMSSLCLFDNDLGAGDETGLSLAREFGFSANVVLVTGRADSPEVVAGCQAAGVRLLPKNRASIVPLLIDAPGLSPSCVLVDDDELVIKVWVMAARRSGRELMVFRSTKDCLAAAENLDRDVEIYLDRHLGGGERGEDAAKALHGRGFRRIYLASGDAAPPSADMPWLAGMIGKEPPWS